ncbi:hypothetical protein JXQ31_08840 [candidate division KSB1 bacterium]|nr:hypothetical protein [candidate division KSB1 bacterium]
MTISAKTAHILVLIIILFSLVASLTGILWKGESSDYIFTSLRGEEVRMQGAGLYKYDSVSMAAQAVAQDFITLILGIPVLLGSLVFSIKGSLRGRLLLSGTIGYFLYTYASYAFGAAYNQLFLVYVAVFSASLFALILLIRSINVNEIKSVFSPKTPRRLVAGFELFVGTMILFMWLGRILPALKNNIPPVGLETYSTLFIQVLDLGIVVPVAVIAGILLLRQQAWGYVLSVLFLVKGVTLSAAVTAMVVNMIAADVYVAPAEMIIFPCLTVFAVTVTWIFLKHIHVPQGVLSKTD